jgi:hypothetical protein
MPAGTGGWDLGSVVVGRVARVIARRVLLYVFGA